MAAGARFSEDLDLFHDAEDSVARGAEVDAEVLWLAPAFRSGAGCLAKGQLDREIPADN